MTNETRQLLQASVSGIPITNALGRVQNAVYLVATSPQYLVER
jgi:hypothetical protein